MLAPVGGYVAQQASIAQAARTQPTPDIRPIDLEAVQGMKTGGSKWSCSVSQCAVVGIIATMRYVGRSSSSRHSRSNSQSRGVCFVAKPDLSLQNKAVRPTDKLSRAAWDHVIEASYDNSKKVEVKPAGGGDVSLGKYFQMPKKEFVQVPLCYGASMKPIGQQMSSAGTMEDYFECQVPELDFPGVIKMQCSTLVYMKCHGDKMVITGDKTLLRGMGKEMEDTLQENMRFRFDCVTSWPEKDELRMQSKLKIEFDRIDALGAISPDLFTSMSNPVTESVLNVLAGAFLDSFLEDYKKWAEDESFRRERAAAPEVAVAA